MSMTYSLSYSSVRSFVHRCYRPPVQPPSSLTVCSYAYLHCLLSVHLRICLSTNLFTYLSYFPSFYHSINQSLQIPFFVFLSLHLCFYPSIYLSFRLSSQLDLRLPLVSGLPYIASICSLLLHVYVPLHTFALFFTVNAYFCTVHFAYQSIYP